MTDYKWKNDNTKMLRMLRNSKTLKESNKWSREGGGGFIKDDIRSIELMMFKSLKITFSWGGIQTFHIIDLNLRETEEAIKFIESEAEHEKHQ